jgi:formamidopyrimidine-DNA glycosylase
MRSVASDEISGTGGEICKDCGAVIARIEAMKRGTRYE